MLTQADIDKMPQHLTTLEFKQGVKKFYPQWHEDQRTRHLIADAIPLLQDAHKKPHFYPPGFTERKHPCKGLCEYIKHHLPREIHQLFGIFVDGCYPVQVPLETIRDGFEEEAIEFANAQFGRESFSESFWEEFLYEYGADAYYGLPEEADPSPEQVFDFHWNPDNPYGKARLLLTNKFINALQEL